MALSTDETSPSCRRSRIPFQRRHLMTREHKNHVLAEMGRNPPQNARKSLQNHTPARSDSDCDSLPPNYKRIAMLILHLINEVKDPADSNLVGFSGSILSIKTKEKCCFLPSAATLYGNPLLVHPLAEQRDRIDGCTGLILKLRNLSGRQNRSSGKFYGKTSRIL